MVMCNSPWGFWKTCVACMDGQQSHRGTICCDTAEDLDFQEEDILKQCEYAKKEEITDVAKEHSINNVEFEIRAQMYSFSSETSVITVKEIENATKLFTEMCKEYENVHLYAFFISSSEAPLCTPRISYGSDILFFLFFFSFLSYLFVSIPYSGI